MKKLLILALISIGISSTQLSARVTVPPDLAKKLPVTQGEIIPLEVIQDIADRNAAEVWGEIQGTEPIPYYWADGEVIAYRFNYARGKTFPDATQLKAESQSRAEAGDFQGQWGDGEFASILMSARSDMAPFLERMNGLSPDYALGVETERRAHDALSGISHKGRTYLLGLNDIWYEFEASGKKVLVNPTPPAQVMTDTEFQTHLQAQNSFFVAIDDYSEEWEVYANGTRMLSRDDVMIPLLEHMPFVQWTYGCSPCSATMLFAWWDNISIESSWKFANLVKYYHYRWDNIQNHNDYHVPDVAYDVKCAMDTDNEGGTYIWDIDDGIVEVADDRGYGAQSETLYYHNYPWFWDYLRGWIDSGGPLLTNIIGHTMTGVGYNSANNEYINHDPNHGTLNYRNKSSLYALHPVQMNSSWSQAAVKLLSPHGDTGWHSMAGDGDVFSDGDFCSITWDGDFDQDTYARIYLSIDGGEPGSWEEITAWTENDGSYDWQIPDGMNSPWCRIRIDVLDQGSTLVGADSNWGDFTIEQGAGIPELQNEVIYEPATDPDYYKFNHSDTTWCVVGVQHIWTDAQWEIELYDDTTFATPIATSPISAFNTKYVVMDRHHMPEQYRGIKVQGEPGSEYTHIEYEGGSETLTVGGGYQSDWSAGEVVEMYDIWLEPGDYNFHLERYPSGVADLDMALYYFDSPPYCGGRTDHFINARSQNIGNTVDESFWAPVSEAGWYGLVVSSRNNGYGEFRLHIHPDGSWSGDVSTDWHDPTNWHSGSVPNSSTDVIITAGRPNYPILEGASGYCDGLELKPGASLTLNHDLYVGGHAHIAGDLHMALTSAYLYASQHLYCEAGCDLDMAAGTEIRLSGNLIVEEGALVDPQAGSFIFEGFEGAGIQNHDNRTSFHNIENHKDYYPLHFSSFCTEDFTITGNLILLNNTTLEGDSPHRVTLNGGIYKLPGSFFYFEDGEFIFENSTSNLTPDPMDYFHNLTLIDSEISLQSDLYVNGDLNTISGNLNLWSYQLYLQGDWNNHAGAGVLGTTTTGTVAFYGIDEDQSLIGDTDIPTLLLQNWFGELYCPSGTINCENWHWSLGTLHIDGAVFTADDIVTSTLQGAYIVDAGELNLHQDETDYVDLNASIDISGGFMRVYGGYAIDSYWPYTQNASITMSGGVLDFVDNGIYLYDGAYTLTDIITGGTIRTGGNFTGLRHDFNPGGGTIELYGGSDAQLGHGIGSSFHDVLVNKGTAMLDRGPVVQPEKGKKNRKDVRDTMAEQIIRYRHDGSSYPVDRMSTVTVVSTLDIDDDLVFQDGFFVPDANVVDMDGDFDIYGTLMIDSEDYIRVGTDIFWRDGSQCSAQGGEIHCEGGWIFYDGCNVPLQSVVTVYMDGTGPGEIHNYSHSLNARFGELVIDKFQGGRVSLAESGYPIEAVQLRCTPSDTIFGGSSTLEVDSLLLLETGSAFIGGNGGNVTCDDITIAGLLDLGEGILTVHDNFLLDAGGSLNLAGGQVLCDRAYTGNFMSIAGALNFSEGLFQVVNEGLQFGGGTYSNISGGIIRLGWGLRALYENGLQPSGGTVEFTGASYPTIECNNGNYLHDLTIDKSGGMVYTMYPLTLNGDLHLINRTLNAQGNDLTIGGDLLIEPGGQLDPDEGTVSVGLNWTNLRGAIGFIETNSSVTFTGDMPASINNAETFHNLNVDKPTAVGYFFEIPDALTIDVLGDLQLYTGPLMLHDAVTLDVAGDIHIYSGAGLCAYPLYNGIEIEIGGSLFNYNSTYDYRVGFNPGTSLVTFNGTGDQYIETWPTAEFWDLTIDKPSGTLIKDCNLWIQHDFNFLAGSWDSYNQPEVIHTFEGDLYQAAAADLFDPYATFYLTGTAEQLIDLQGSYQFADLILYKGEPVLQQVLTPSLAGKEAAHTEQERSEPVILQHDLTVSGGDLVIENGTLQLNGYTLTADGGEELTVYEDGILNLSPGSQLLLGDLMYLFVTGRLELLGSEAEPAVLSHAASGHYFCDITGGGTLSAEHALFEYMGTAGINIDYSGNLDPVHTLHHCTFQQGPMFGTLLQINTTQAGLVINGAHFPDNSWNGMFNVSRYLPQPPFETVTFAGATGGFAGVAWEDDPDGLIDWTSGGDPDLQVTDLYWSDTAPYVVDYVELHYTIANTGDAPSGQSTLGLYYDLAVPPTVGDTPDETLIISSIAPAEAFSSSIWVTSLDAAEWSSWLLADCLGEIVESNEGNNYGGPGAISWLPLPAVDDLEISYDPDYYMATLTWSYPIWVQYFNIYRGTTPYFTPGLENLIASQIETTYIDDDLPDEYFYQVTAVREWVVATGEELPLEQQIPLDR